MPKLPIYLDNSATTPLDPRVLDKMLPYLTEHHGNPASTHATGRIASRAVEAAREQVAQLVGAADETEIVWTSGATESNNLALKGAAQAHRARGRHFVTVETEHRAVLDTMQELERSGCEITYLPPQPNGLLDPARFAEALRDDTVLASVMLVNNEIGVIQDVAELGRLCRERGVLLHVDAAQATGKLPIDLAALPVDLMSLTAHKTYGPKGIGALYVRKGPRNRPAAQMHGGGHERGLRSGTLATHQIVGMGESLRLAGLEMAEEVPRIRALRDRLWNGVRDLPGIRMNGDPVQRIAHNLNISLDVDNCGSLLTSLTDIAISSASACSSGLALPSHVLQALGAETPGATMRITVGRFNTEADIDYAIAHLREKINECLAGRAAAVH